MRRRLAAVAAGAVAARCAYTALRRRPPGDPDAWARTNHRGDPITLLEGPAYTLAAGAGVAAAPGVSGRVRVAGALAALGAGAFGGYDDLRGSGASRGFAGHLGALARGEVTSGAVKLLGIGATGLAAAALLPAESGGVGGVGRVGRVADIVIGGAVVAGSANLVNLFDLRPGRAIKVGLLAGIPALATTRRRGTAAALAAAPVGAAAALLPEDLGERAMLGDAGANALGAALGLAATAGLGRGGRLCLLGGLAGLTAASEVVSFTRVIDAVGPLLWFDRLGRAARDAG